jgi:RNA polymerase sigma-70 factor, ECF subfamily
MDTMDEMSPERLLRRWEAMRERVVVSLKGRGFSEDDAQDLFGEALVRAIARKDSLDNAAAAEGWFWKLAHRLAIDVVRRRASRPRNYAGVDLETLAAPVEDDETNICSCSLQILEELPVSSREILRAVDVEGLAVQDYAEKTNISPNNASVRLFRARRAMRARMFETCQTTTVAECLDCGCD